MATINYQLDANGTAQPQTQSGEDGAADVNIASGVVGIDATANGVVCQPSILPSSAPQNFSSTAYVTNNVIKATGGTLYRVTGYNSKASAQFIQLFDANTLPAESAIPKVTITAAASSNFTIDFGIYGRRFVNGIVICNSSTGPTKTIGSADIFIDAQFV